MIWPLLLLTGEGGGEETPAEGDGNPPPSSTTGRGIDDEDEIRDPKALVKSLREANARLAKKLDKKDQRIKELEDGSGDIRSARLETAFIRAVFEHRDSIDLEASWDLANLKGYLDAVRVDDDGSVDMASMEEAVERLVERYPYLIQEADSAAAPAPPLPSTRHPKPPKGKKEADSAALAKRFPALRGRRGRL